MDTLHTGLLWTTWSASSIISVTLSNRPSAAFQPLHSNLQFLRSSKTAANACFVGFVIAAVAYIAVLQTLALRYARSAALAVLTGFSLLLCEAAWEPKVFTTAERLLFFLPLYLNIWLSWAVYSAPAPTSASVQQREADSKVDSESMLQSH